MNAPGLAKWLPAAVGILGGLSIAWWWWGGRVPPEVATPRVPGTDRVFEGTNTVGLAASWEGKLIASNGVPAPLPGAWPRFRGPNLDGISPETVPLAKTWGAGEPKALWSIDVGEGYAGPVIWQGRVYLMDYDHQAQADAIRCLSFADGAEIWRYTYPVKVKRDHGMSRTVPSVTEKALLTMGPKCHVHCLDPVSGALRWRMNLVADFNAEVPPWYAGQCPLIDGDLAILAPGGDALLVAVDLATGQVRWKSPNPHNWQMTHSSVAPMEFQGRRLYVYCASGGVVGINAADGALLWETPDWRISIANVPTPVPLPGDRIFLSGGYGAGSLMLQLKEVEGKIVPEKLFRLKAAVFGSTQQTPIFYENHLYGVRPMDNQLVCLNLDGKVLWQSGAANRFGSGPYLLAQGMLYVLNDSGTLTLAAAQSSSYQPLAQAKVLDGHDSWGPMALAGGRLLVRDLLRMTCLDVAARP